MKKLKIISILLFSIFSVLYLLNICYMRFYDLQFLLFDDYYVEEITKKELITRCAVSFASCLFTLIYVIIITVRSIKTELYLEYYETKTVIEQYKENIAKSLKQKSEEKKRRKIQKLKERLTELESDE